MQTRIFAIAITLFCLNAAGLRAQSTNDVGPQISRNQYFLQKKSVIPPSPAAADLGKYGDLPINNFTGALNLSIPIQTIKGNDIGTSVSLSYDGSGNKVETLPGLVGLGWTLNAGGVITRSVQGKPDVDANYFSKANEILNLPNSSAEIATNEYFYKVAKGEIETQPDVFYFNFNGFSGKFAFKPDNTIVMKDAKDLLIQPTGQNGNWVNFKITDALGNKYYFEETEITNLTYEYDNNTTTDIIPAIPNFNYISAWYLTKIEAANTNESIEFTYTTTHASPLYYEQPKNGSAYASKSYSYMDGANPNVALQPISSPNLNTHNKISDRKFIHTILYKLGTDIIEKVEFVKSTPNLTFNGQAVKTDALKLDEIKIYAGLNAGIAMKKFNIVQNNPSTNRLTLNKVEEESILEPTIPKKIHEFIYETTSLPALESNAIDHWGYYNGFSNSTGLIPFYSAQLQGDQANRTSTSDSKASILVQVKYPTGGYSVIDHEIHTVAAANAGSPDRQIGGVRVKEIRNYTATGVMAHKKQYAYILENTTASSGILLGEEPSYYAGGTYKNYPVTVAYHQYGGTITTTNTPTLSATSRANLGNVQGSTVGYSRIEEITDGKVVYWYRAVKLNITEWDDNDNGNLLKKQIFHTNGKKLSEAVNTYVTDSRRSLVFTSFTIDSKPEQDNLIQLCKLPSPYNYDWRNPSDIYTGMPVCLQSATFKSKFQMGAGVSFRQSWKLMTQSIDRQYFYDANWVLINTVETSNDNIYGNAQISYPTESTMTNSDSKTYKTKTYFTQDVVGNSQTSAAVISSMISKYMIGIPIRTEKWVGTSLVSATEIEYFNSGTLILPNKLKLKDRSSSNWTVKYTIDTYNGVGLPTKVTMGGFLKSENYLWNRHLLQSKSFGDTYPNLLTWAFGYDAKDRAESIINENGVKTHYEYDGLSRLKIIRSLLNAAGDPASAKAKTTMDYHYGIGTGTANFIKNTVWFNDASNSLLGNGNMFQTIQYFDGLGRATETVKEKYTHLNGQHQKTYMTYDNFGRQNRSYQPIESNINGFETIDPAIARSVKPYTNPIYESSPLSRPLKQINEDESEVQSAYGSNTTTDAVKLFTLDANNILQIGNYAVNQLYKTTITDENGNQTSIFKDKLGRVVLTRKIAESNQFVDTYNVYNDFGDLVAVIPPDAYNVNNVVNNLIFRYSYDNKHRLCEKKIPGAEPQKFYYNVRDQLVLTQDGNMKDPLYGGASDKHLATRYDDYGRVVETGWVNITPPATGDVTATITITAANSLSQITYITGKSLIQQTKYRVLGYKKATDVDWIDTYTYNYDQWARPYRTESVTLNGQYDMSLSELSSSGWAWFKAHQFTGPDNQNRSTFTYNWHDHSMRPHLTQHKIALDASWTYGTPLQYVSWNVYDHKDQLSQKRLGGAWVPALGDYRFTQNVNYEYNSRNWLTKINTGDLSATSGTAKEYPLFYCGNFIPMDNYNGTYSNPPTQSYWGDANPDLFTQILRYDNPNIDIGNVPQQKNGNISQIEWQVAGREKQAYSYTYDKLNRLTEAKYADIHTGNWSTNGWPTQIDQNNRYNETMTYDKRGNILSLVRKGVFAQDNNGYNGLMCSIFATIDNLTYTLNDKNQVTQIADAANGAKGFKHNGSPSVYAYDNNGNLISDSQKGISTIEYNYLNLPIRITFTDLRKIEFIYDATGRKWRKTVINANGTTNNYRDYIGEAEYQNGQQDIIHFSEGYAQRDVTTDGDGVWNGWVYKYTLKDHLGNTRVTYSDRDKNGLVTTADIEQVNHYYPFGLNMEGPWNGAGGAFKNQYNGKELNSDFGLDWNDYGARFYDAAIGRWGANDPLAESFSSFSPYNYALNNPVLLIDENGMASSYNWDNQRYEDEKGNEVSWEDVQKELGTGNSPDNEYKIITKGGEVQSVEMTGTKGGDVTDHITVVDMDKAPRADGVSTYDVDVDIEYTSGPGNIHKQKTDPTPGSRETHGKNYTDLEAFSWLIPGGKTAAASTILSATVKRVASKTLRKLWEKFYGKTWPTEPSDPTKNQTLSHKTPLADGGDNSVGNIEPMPAKQHHEMHKANGDYSRWSKKK